MQARVLAPTEALIGGKSAGALAFEEKKALAEGVVVVMGACSAVGEEEEEEESRRETWRKSARISRHMECSCWWLK